VKRIDYYCGIFILAAAIVIGGSGQRTGNAQAAKLSVPNVIKAHEFDLTDTNGHLGVEISMKNSAPTIFLYDRNGKPRVLVTVDEGGLGTVAIGGDDIKVKAMLGENSSGTGMVVLRNAQGTKREIKPTE